MRGYYQRIADMLDLDRMGERLPGPPRTGFLARHGKQIRRAVAWSAALLVIATGLIFAGDYVLLRYRMRAGGKPLGTVIVRPYYAVRLKSGKTEFLFQNPRPETCVNSLMSHLGMSPCWHLRRHPEKRIDINPE